MYIRCLGKREVIREMRGSRWGWRVRPSRSQLGRSPTCSASGLVEIPLVKIKEGGFYPGIFWATIPGALVIIALSLAFYVHVLAKFNLIKEQEESNANA